MLMSSEKVVLASIKNGDILFNIPNNNNDLRNLFLK